MGKNYFQQLTVVQLMKEFLCVLQPENLTSFLI